LNDGSDVAFAPDHLLRGNLFLIFGRAIGGSFEFANASGGTKGESNGACLIIKAPCSRQKKVFRRKDCTFSIPMVYALSLTGDLSVPDYNFSRERLWMA